MTANVHYFPLINSLITRLFSLTATLKPPNYLCLTPLDTTFLLILCLTLTILATFYEFYRSRFLVLMQSFSLSMAAMIIWERADYFRDFNLQLLISVHSQHCYKKTHSKVRTWSDCISSTLFSWAFFVPLIHVLILFLLWCSYTTCGHNMAISITGQVWGLKQTILVNTEACTSAWPGLTISYIYDVCTCSVFWSYWIKLLEDMIELCLLLYAPGSTLYHLYVGTQWISTKVNHTPMLLVQIKLFACICSKRSF